MRLRPLGYVEGRNLVVEAAQNAARSLGVKLVVKGANQDSEGPRPRDTTLAAAAGGSGY